MSCQNYANKEKCLSLSLRIELIEVKEMSKWKHAIGQLKTYGMFYPQHKLVMFLFGSKKPSNMKSIEYVASQMQIHVKLYLASLHPT